MVQQDKVLYDDRQPPERSNPFGRIAANCALGAIGALLLRAWLRGNELLTVVFEFFIIVLSALAVVLGIRGLLAAKKYDLAPTGAIAGLVVGAGTLVLVALASFAMRPSADRGQAEQRCRENLEMIGQAAANYAAGHDGQLPQNPHVLADPRWSDRLNASRLVCDLDAQRPERNAGGEYCSYTWIAGHGWGDGSHVAACCRGEHGDATPVLMADGTVTSMAPAALADALEETRPATRP